MGDSIFSRSLIRCLFSLFFVVVACSRANDGTVIITEPVYITNHKIVLTPDMPLQAEGRFNQLCFEIPDGFRQDRTSWSMLSGDGTKIAPYAALTSQKGVRMEFYQRSFLNNGKKYICLSPDAQISPKTSFKEIMIWSNRPFWTEEVIWLSTDKT